MNMNINFFLFIVPGISADNESYSPTVAPAAPTDGLRPLLTAAE